MLTPDEQGLLEHLNRYFFRLVEAEAPLEPSLEILVRTLAMVLAMELEARGGETALTRTVDPYQRLLKTWTREAFLFATRGHQGLSN